jgi:hypothetical protein
VDELTAARFAREVAGLDPEATDYEETLRTLIGRAQTVVPDVPSAAGADCQRMSDALAEWGSAAGEYGSNDGEHEAGLELASIVSEVLASAAAGMIAIPGGEVRILCANPAEGDFSPVYVMDVLGLTLLARVREGDTFVNVDTDGMAPMTQAPLVVNVCNGGENEYRVR